MSRDERTASRERTPRLFVVSGPSGAGKGTLVKRALELRPELGLTISATTRLPREKDHEVDGVSYYFLSEEEFSRRLEAGAFLEWANVHGHRYGTLVSEVERLLAEDRSIILEIDVQGGLQVREKRPDTVLVFVNAPSREELERRLRGRGTEDEATVQLRLDNARAELELSSRYDKIIVNDDLDTAARELLETIDSYERN